jgi:hypothetical protein
MIKSHEDTAGHMVLFPEAASWMITEDLERM